MCNKITVLTLLYVTIFVAVVKSEDAASERVVDFMNKGENSYNKLRTGIINWCFLMIINISFYPMPKFLIVKTYMSVGRTFGHNALKRLSFIFLPVMFTLGVISTLLMALAVISVKNLAIGVILLIVAISQAVSRLFFAASAPSSLVHLHPRAELLPAPVAAPWPAPGPLLSPWARSDNDATISD